MLLDTGNGVSILEYLAEQGATRLERILISHADSDHAGGLITLLADPTFEINSVRLNADAFKDSELWRALAYELDDWGRQPGHDYQIGMKEGDSFVLGSFALEILAPRARLTSLGPGAKDREGRRLEANTLSVVVRVLSGDDAVALVPGDLDSLGLEHLMDRVPAPDLTAPVLVFPHHGGHVGRGCGESANIQFTERLIGLVQPDLVVFSLGRGHHETPRPEIVDAVRRTKPGVRIQCTQLSTHCAPSLPEDGAPQDHVVFNTARGLRKGWCCAGSVVLKSNNGRWEVIPAEETHGAFVVTNAPTALCIAGDRTSPRTV
ncbi:MAG: hypothetical protein QG608_456 [Actinomycetota bacterium]|nr:hypothetical protein [Actinomycetota bacterium]